MNHEEPCELFSTGWLPRQTNYSPLKIAGDIAALLTKERGWKSIWHYGLELSHLSHDHPEPQMLLYNVQRKSLPVGIGLLVSSIQTREQQDVVPVIINRANLNQWLVPESKISKQTVRDHLTENKDKMRPLYVAIPREYDFQVRLLLQGSATLVGEVKRDLLVDLTRYTKSIE